MAEDGHGAAPATGRSSAGTSRPPRWCTCDGRTWEALSAPAGRTSCRGRSRSAYRQLSTAAMNMAAVPRAQDFMVDAIAQYISDPAVQVITSPAGLLDRLPDPATPPGSCWR